MERRPFLRTLHLRVPATPRPPDAGTRLRSPGREEEEARSFGSYWCGNCLRKQAMYRYYRYFTENVIDAINIGASELIAIRRNELSPEFILVGILMQEDSPVLKIFRELGLEPKRTSQELLDRVFEIEELVPPIEGDSPIHLVVPKTTQLFFEQAKREADTNGDAYIGIMSVFLAFYDASAGVAAQILKEHAQLGNQRRVRKIVQELRGERKIMDRWEEACSNQLSRFTTDLTALARRHALDPLIGREDILERIIEVLARRKKNNPLLIGEPGVGKTVIVEGLAQRIVRMEVPEMLLNKRLLLLDLGEIVAGAKFRGEFEERLKMIQDEITAAAGRIILFIDELHQVVNAGAAMGGLDASNMLKPALAKGNLLCIGATTIDDYKKFIEIDKGLERRFQPILVREPSPTETLEILEGLRPCYETFHHVTFTPEALQAAVSLSERYITDRCLPDKAIDLLDEAAGRKRIETGYFPRNLRDLRKEKERIRQEQLAAYQQEDYRTAMMAQQRLIALELELKTKQRRWQEEIEPERRIVTEEDVAQLVARWTEIPVFRVMETEKARLLEMEERLHERIIGQHDAICAVSNAIRRNRAGLKDPRRPIGTFLFLGPTGVGKTELARALAEHLLDDENRLIRLDMSEYMERHEVSKIIGAPPGYLGYGEGGQLTEKIRRQPYSVLLLDEIEKAHPDVFNILLQILDEGRLTDAHGRTVSFRNTIIIGTSNIGSAILTRERLSAGFSSDEEDSEEETRERILAEVKKYFKPEFLNRIDDLIVFHRLGPQDVRQIVELMLRDLLRRLEEKKIRLEISDAVKAFLAAEGFDPIYGARPLKRTIERFLENPLAQDLIAGRFEAGDTILANLSGKEIRFEKRQPAPNLVALFPEESKCES
ncbi:MAG: AAA family ATPase [Deltaproteobacteria bacterium]|nr:MAG: AAA family ATPase [Deltaproteobacteria bacterium]